MISKNVFKNMLYANIDLSFKAATCRIDRRIKIYGKEKGLYYRR